MLTTEELSIETLAFVRKLQTRGVSLGDIASGLLGTSVAIHISRLGVDETAACLERMADQVRPSAESSMN